MITKITGTLNRALDEEVRLQVGPLEYQVMVPEFVRRQVQGKVGQELTLHTNEYLEGNPAHGRMVPRLIGFASEAELEGELRMHRAEIESMVAMWRSGRQRLQHFESTLLPLARDRSRAVLTAYGSGRGDQRAVLDALRDEVDLQREYVALEGDVTRAWAFLHLLHSSGATP